MPNQTYRLLPSTASGGPGACSHSHVSREDSTTYAATPSHNVGDVLQGADPVGVPHRGRPELA
jgi:hypothetical protein